MSARFDHQCQNGSCARLATCERDQAGIGRRLFCYFCAQALDALGIFQPRQVPLSGQKVSPLTPSAA